MSSIAVSGGKETGVEATSKTGTAFFSAAVTSGCEETGVAEVFAFGVAFFAVEDLVFSSTL